MEISSKRGSQKAPELPLDLTLTIIHVYKLGACELEGMIHTCTQYTQFIAKQTCVYWLLCDVTVGLRNRYIGCYVMSLLDSGIGILVTM